MVIRAMGSGRFSDDERQNCTSTVDQGRNIERYIAQRGGASAVFGREFPDAVQ